MPSEGVAAPIAPEVSVVVPVFGCARTLAELHARVAAVLDAAGVSFELVLVEDGGGDGAWDVICELAGADPRVVGYRLSRNFGQHAALTAGIVQASGRVIVPMDCDLQDPPEELPRMLAAVREGAPVVLMRRTGTFQSPWRRWAGRAYGRFYRLATGIPRETSLGTFSAITRPVADAFLQVHDRERQYIPLLTWLGFRRVVLEYERPARAGGGSSYTFARLFRHGLSGLFFSTTRVLSWTIYGGLALAAMGIALALFYVFRHFFADPPPGFTTIIVVQLLVGGSIMIALGVSALYVGKTFEQVRGRPLYIVAERVGGDGSGEAPNAPM